MLPLFISSFKNQFKRLSDLDLKRWVGGRGRLFNKVLHGEAS